MYLVSGLYLGLGTLRRILPRKLSTSDDELEPLSSFSSFIEINSAPEKRGAKCFCDLRLLSSAFLLKPSLLDSEEILDDLKLSLFDWDDKLDGTFF